MRNYKYDIAISLCKEDVSFARKLVAALNPNLKVFFYEDKQEELISKSGPEAFAKVFKEECRVVVILSRKEWSETFYTDLEKNAIVDRLSSGKEGYGFLFVIPLAPKQVPAWYPETRIYADPTRFSIEELAKFIEFKVIDKGGEVKPVSFKERAEALVAKTKDKKELIKAQQTPEAVSAAEDELTVVIDLIKTKFEHEIKTAGFSKFGFKPYDIYMNKVYIIVNDKQLFININNPWNQMIIQTNQVYSIEFVISDLPSHSTIIKSALYRFIYNPMNSGWAEVVDYSSDQVNQFNEELLFKLWQNYYDLKGRTSSAYLIEYWFNQLLNLVANDLAKHIN
ncbi:MAG: hypothetical protein ACK5XN_00075 [Bacteroidota bacterium]